MALQLNETPFSTTQNTYSRRYCFSLFFEQIQREILKTIKKAYGGKSHRNMLAAAPFMSKWRPQKEKKENETKNGNFDDENDDV